jgi:hypothetical protein
MSTHCDLARNGRVDKRSESSPRMKSSAPESSSGEPNSDHDATLEALRSSPHCRPKISSCSMLGWMLSSPAQLAAIKRAFEALGGNRSSPREGGAAPEWNSARRHARRVSR